jgi:radical SAM protein with 4Fe4S-binding SPASM domain
VANALHLGQQPVDPAANFRSETRQSTLGPCLQPWETVIVEASGNVVACCGTNFSFGNVNQRPLDEILDGTEARSFRARLLAGGPDLPCATCPIASGQTAPEFESSVRAAHARCAAQGTTFRAPAPSATA